MPLALADLLEEKLVDLDLGTRSVQAALAKLVGLLRDNGLAAQPDEFLKQIIAREHVNPSVVENGVAFPHARTDLAEKIVLAIGRSRSGIAFVKDGPKAKLIFLIGVPQRLVNDYLVVLGALARLLKEDEVRQRLLSAKTPAAFLQIIRAATEERPFG